jgi:PAS domain S-box-containing protein
MRVTVVQGHGHRDFGFHFSTDPAEMSPAHLRSDPGHGPMTDSKNEPGRSAPLGIGAMLKRPFSELKTESATLRDLQKKILDVLLLAGAVLGFVAVVPSVWLSFKEHLYFVGVLDIAIFLYVLTLLFSNRFSYTARSVSACAICYLAGMLLFIVIGPFGAGPVWLFTFPILAAVLIGVRAGIAGLVINTLTLVVISVPIYLGSPIWHYPATNSVEKWFVICVNFVLLNSLATISTATILRGLNKTLRKERQLKQTMSGHAQQLSDANLGMKREIAAREQATEALEQTHDIIRASPVVAFTWRNSPGWPIEFVTENVLILLGHTANELTTGEWLFSSVLHPGDLERITGEVDRFSRDSTVTAFTHEPYRIISRDKNVKWVEDFTTIIRNSRGEVEKYMGVVIDVSEKRKLEDQLVQSQKMEAIGQLAGGVAHDFNNILTAITGFSELIVMDLTDDDPIRSDISEITNAADSAALLTRQLLAFSRKEIIDPKVLDINEAVSRSEKMLQRLIGEDIELAFIPKDGLWKVIFDPGQVEQILVNLAVNARDAMRGGGKLTLETENTVLKGENIASVGDDLSGEYVMITVSDTGQGMDAETKRRIFEPFFTTKEKGKGTGLGLSTVYGILDQNQGSIAVYSEPGSGTTFQIYIPRSEVAEAAETFSEESEDLSGSETILVVEDQEMVRKLAKRTLEHYGYRVLTADDGIDALGICEKNDGEIDLVVTDVVMPRMSGKALFDNITKSQPELKVLFMSGYTEDAIAHHGVLEAGTNFIQKPFHGKAFAKKVRDVLDAGDASRTGGG